MLAKKATARWPFSFIHLRPSGQKEAALPEDNNRMESLE